VAHCSLLLRFSLVSGPWQEQAALAAARSEYLSKQREMAKQKAAQNRSSAQQSTRHGQSSPSPAAAEQQQQRSPQQGPQQRSLPEYQQQLQLQKRPSTVAEANEAAPSILPQEQQQKASTVAEENVFSPSIVAAAAAAGLIRVSLFSISLAFGEPSVAHSLHTERHCVQSFAHSDIKGPAFARASTVAQASTMRSSTNSLN
jgi:predicted RNA-binding protein YlxR (DUF448 family)